jgi:enoyl-CoA hydratase
MLTISDGVALLTLDQGKANAMSTVVLDAIDELLDKFSHSDAAGAVITGYDRFFSAGLALPTLIDLDRAAMKTFITRFSEVMGRLFAEPRPVVAAINGHAIAGGCVLALMCDVRIMADGDFKIGLNEVQLGIGLPAIVTEALRIAVPPASLVPLAMQGELVSPARARELGLVHEVVATPELLLHATARARALAANPPAGVRHVKQALRLPARDAIQRYGSELIESWLDTWFSPPARQKLADAVARLR